MYYTGNSRDFSSFKNKGAIGRECKSDYNLVSFQANGSITVLVVLSLVFLWALAQFGRAPDLGSGGRVFKSLMPNYRIKRNTTESEVN